MWLNVARSLVRLVTPLLAIALSGCSSSRQYVGTSDEVWAAMVSAIREEYRKAPMSFPGVSGEGQGEFFIPVRTADAVDRPHGTISLSMPGEALISMAQAEIRISPVNADKPVPHQVSVRVWNRSWVLGYSKFSSEDEEMEILSAIDRSWARRAAASRPAK